MFQTNCDAYQSHALWPLVSRFKGAESTTVYEQVMERTRDLNLRSAALEKILKNFVSHSKNEKVKKTRAAMEEE